MVNSIVFLTEYDGIRAFSCSECETSISSNNLHVEQQKAKITKTGYMSQCYFCTVSTYVPSVEQLGNLPALCKNIAGGRTQNAITCLALWKHHVNLLLHAELSIRKLGSSSVLII